MYKLRIAGTMVVGVACASALAADKWSGYLCCNMRTDGSWITDINYDEPHKHLIPVGSPVMVTGYGHFRVKVMLENKSQAIGNDYSRDLSMEDFAKRYVVADDPNAKISGYPQKVQDAIHQARVMVGMNREQVLMAVGYPVSSENHVLADKTWRYWLFSWSEFKVHFDDGGRVTSIETDSDTREKVVAQ
jgi:hypothetical protein